MYATRWGEVDTQRIVTLDFHLVKRPMPAEEVSERRRVVLAVDPHENGPVSQYLRAGHE